MFFHIDILLVQGSWCDVYVEWWKFEDHLSKYREKEDTNDHWSWF
jgi:hypothetical protein